MVDRRTVITAIRSVFALVRRCLRVVRITPRGVLRRPEDHAVVGALDDVSGPSADGAITVKGWAVGLRSPVSRVQLSVDGRPIGPAGLHRHRSDVGDAIQRDLAELAGFEATFQVAAASETPSVLTAAVHLLDGTVESLPVVPLPPPAAAFEAAPEPAVARAATPPRLVRFAGTRVRLLCGARSLDHGGSQRRMLEMVTFLVSTGRFDVTVASPSEGPLRSDLEAGGAEVAVQPIPLDTLEGYRARLTALTSWARGRFDVVFGATLSSFPVVDLADRLGLPSIWRVGESEPPGVVYRWLQAAIDPGVERVARRAFQMATLVYFNSQAALDRYRRDGVAGRFAMLRTGTHIERIDAFVAATDRGTLRASLGLDPRRRVLVCVGAIWPIKGQAALVAALHHLGEAAANFQTVFVGAHGQPYADAIQRFVDQRWPPGVLRLLPFCDDPRPWFHAADVAVCPSESESMPAAVIEAMAFGRPVLACRAGGLPEVVEDGVTGWLCDRSDVSSLAEALRRVANATPETLRSLGAHAGRRARADHDRAVILRRMADLFEAAASGKPLSQLAPTQQVEA